MECPEGGGSATPIFLLAGALSVLSLAAGLTFLVVRVRRWRRRAGPPIVAFQRRR